MRIFNGILITLYIRTYVITCSVRLREMEEGGLERVGRRLSHVLGVNLNDAASEPYMVSGVCHE